MDLTIHVFLEDFHNTVALPSIKTYPLVYFESLVLDIQLASLHLSSVIE
jgi:hypothetical protein